ncbi:MAG: T9SS type A sorting domain-containing protein [Bacteroidia bacterium]|jgi:hypothetical protein|nr:T9SS type A sorting domain-containing protein [Bacteroidia bacterium]
MKTRITTLLLSLTFVQFLSANIKTSIANGNWNNPSIWMPAGVPASSDDVVINSHVTANTMMVILHPVFTVNQGASFTVTSGIVNFSNGSFSNSGTISVEAMRLYMNNSFFNYGQILISQAFENEGPITNTPTGSICVSGEMMISDLVTNSGSISTDTLMNFSTFLNNGKVCVSNVLFNTGSMTGTGDLCDATPNNFNDMLSGNIASSITLCQAGPCTACSVPASVNENSRVVLFEISPNPSQGIFRLKFDEITSEIRVDVYDLTGRSIMEKQINAASSETESVIDLLAYPEGMYVVRVSSADFVKTVMLNKIN